jgi:hypothetical protein
MNPLDIANLSDIINPLDIIRCQLIGGQMDSRHQKMAYPLRMEDEVREISQELAREGDRSLNWQLNALIKMAIPIWREQRSAAAAKESAPLAAINAAQ